MIDVNLIRKDAEGVRQRYLKRGKDIDFAPFLQLDEQRKQLISTVEAMKAQRNKVTNVGDIHDRLYFVTVIFQNTAQQVHKQVCTQVANVSRFVNGRATRIH